MKHIKMPFDCVIMDKESKEIANPYTGQKVLLTPEERLEALELLGCSSWKDIEPGTLQKELQIFKELFEIKYDLHII